MVYSGGAGKQLGRTRRLLLVYLLSCPMISSTFGFLGRPPRLPQSRALFGYWFLIANCPLLPSRTKWLRPYFLRTDKPPRRPASLTVIPKSPPSKKERATNSGASTLFFWHASRVCRPTLLHLFSLGDGIYIQFGLSLHLAMKAVKCPAAKNRSD